MHQKMFLIANNRFINIKLLYLYKTDHVDVFRKEKEFNFCHVTVSIVT